MYYAFLATFSHFRFNGSGAFANLIYILTFLECFLISGKVEDLLVRLFMIRRISDFFEKLLDVSLFLFCHIFILLKKLFQRVVRIKGDEG